MGGSESGAGGMYVPSAQVKGIWLAMEIMMLVVHVPGDCVKVLLKSSEVAAVTPDAMSRAQPPRIEEPLSVNELDRSTRLPA